MSAPVHETLCPPRDPGPRAQVRAVTNRRAVGVGLEAHLELYDGAVLLLAVQMGPWWACLRLRLWYSQAALRRSWDQWQAERLAGEHPGVTLLGEEGQ